MGEVNDINDRLMAAVERMPAFPRSVHRVLQLSGDIECSQKELVEVIKNDPVFTLKILRLVNSPYFGLSRKITSINHASVYLGLNTLKNVALGLAAVGAIPKSARGRLDMGAFWLHSLAVAACTRLLGLRLGVSSDDAADYFAAGLLHDIGKVVLALYMAEEFQVATTRAAQTGEPLYLCEQEVLGVSHADIGALLAEKWNLPADLHDAIALHHQVDGEADTPMNLCLFTANQISKKLAYGFAGDFDVAELPASARELFGVDMDELMGQLPTLDEEVENSRVFIKLGEAD